MRYAWRAPAADRPNIWSVAPGARPVVPGRISTAKQRNGRPDAYCLCVLVGFLLALGCSICYGTASVLQAAATRSVEAGSGSGVDAVLLARAARQWRYVVGIGLDGFGFLFQVAALRLVPIYVVAAALAASIAVTGIVAAWLLSARLSSAEWTAVGVVCLSLVTLALAAGPGNFRRAPAALGWALLGVVAAIFLVGAAAGRLPDRPRALALGLAAGSGFGVIEIGVRLIDVTDPTKRSFYTNPALYAAIAGGAAGFLLLTSALHRGSVTTAVAGMVVGETIAPALVGVVWLGDRARDGLGWLVLVGFVVAVSATLVLARFGEAPEPTEGGEAVSSRRKPCGRRECRPPDDTWCRAPGVSTARRPLR